MVRSSRAASDQSVSALVTLFVQLPGVATVLSLSAPPTLEAVEPPEVTALALSVPVPAVNVFVPWPEKPPTHQLFESCVVSESDGLAAVLVPVAVDPSAATPMYSKTQPTNLELALRLMVTEVEEVELFTPVDQISTRSFVPLMAAREPYEDPPVSVTLLTVEVLVRMAATTVTVFPAASVRVTTPDVALAKAVQTAAVPEAVMAAPA